MYTKIVNIYQTFTRNMVTSNKTQIYSVSTKKRPP